jgi:hypothetical protein
VSNDAQRPTESRRLRWRAIRQAVEDLWRDYHWPVKLTLALIIASSLWGAAIVGWPELDADTAPFVRALASDPARNLMTFVIAFLIAVNFYVRARRGVLDGDEHYNVARALAFGYYKNFLVPALQLARRAQRELQVFRPSSMEQLRRYSTDLEPRLRKLFEHEWMPLVEAPAPGGPPRRTVLALQSPSEGTDVEGAPFFFDAPTALFTVNDFYDALNRRRMDDGKEPINPETVRRYQNGQIGSFFHHLAFLFDTEAGYTAVRDIVPTREDLADLRNYLREVTMAELEARYPG